MPFDGSVSAFAADLQFVERFRIFDALLREELLIVIDHPIIDEDRDRIEPAVALRRIVEAGLAEIGEIVIGRGDRGVGEVGAQILHPLALGGDALLHMQREVHDIEARAARGELDHHLLALLLLGDLLGGDLDPGELGELLLVALVDIGARRLREDDIDLLPGEALPIEFRLRIGRCARKPGRRAPRPPRRSA